jgi:hypothetical protein
MVCQLQILARLASSHRLVKDDEYDIRELPPNIHPMGNHAWPDIFHCLDGDFGWSLPDVHAKKMENICSRFR